MRKAIRMAAAIAFLVAPAAWAHEGGIHARGILQRIGAESIAIKTAEGDRSFSLTPATSFARGGRPAAREDLRTGDRVVVHAHERNGQWEATQVWAAPAADATRIR
jgi:hypothetical protein